jgi:hypothetical protein
MRVCLYGGGGGRTPLAHAAYRTHLASEIELVSDPRRADLMVTGCALDVRTELAALAQVRADRPSLKLAVLSETPLWDTLWAQHPAQREQRVAGEAGEVEFGFIGYQNSEIFDFQRIPYALTVDDELIARYNFLFSRGGLRSPRDLVRAWSAAPFHAAFAADRRVGQDYGRVYPDVGLAGLSQYRTQVAERMGGPRVLRLGAGWGEVAEREEGGDCRLDKLARLRERAFLISAIENAHQASYISGNLFDAFACDAVPVYCAAPFHAVHRLSPGGFVNLYGFSADAAADLLKGRAPDVEMAEAWLAAREHLAGLFCDPVALQTERELVAGKVVETLREVLDGAWSRREPKPARPPREAPAVGLQARAGAPFRRVRFVERAQEEDYRHIALEVLAPRFGDIAAARIHFRMMILQPGEFALQIERSRIFPSEAADRLDWRDADGRAATSLALRVDTSSNELSWTYYPAPSLHAFLVALAENLPAILAACETNERADAEWIAAARTLAAGARFTMTLGRDQGRVA